MTVIYKYEDIDNLVCLKIGETPLLNFFDWDIKMPYF